MDSEARVSSSSETLKESEKGPQAAPGQKPARKPKPEAEDMSLSRERAMDEAASTTDKLPAKAPPARKAKAAPETSSNLAVPPGDEGGRTGSSGSLERKSTSGNQTSGSEENVDKPDRKKRSAERRNTTGILKKPAQNEEPTQQGRIH